jgi:hypothetical protein
MMNPIQSLFLIVLFVTSEFAAAQTVYESPHVKNGRTFQFNLPKGYFEISNSPNHAEAVYTKQKGLDFEKISIDTLSIGRIGIVHAPKVLFISETFLSDAVDQLKKDNEEIIITHELEERVINGFTCTLAGFKGRIGGEELTGAYLWSFSFGDYYVLVTYFELEGAAEVMDFASFEEIIYSLSEVETSKKNQLYVAPESNEVDKSFVQEILLEHYKNDVFETKLSPLDIVPELSDNWMVPMEGNTHLLFELVYKRDKGSINIFSGGLAEKFTSEQAMSAAIEQVLGSSSNLKLVFKQAFFGEQLEFYEYEVSNGGAIVTLYTSLVNEELIFFVVDQQEDLGENYPTEAKNCVVSIWIKSFEGVIFEEEPTNGK